MHPQKVMGERINRGVNKRRHRQKYRLFIQAPKYKDWQFYHRKIVTIWVGVMNMKVFYTVKMKNLKFDG